MVLFKTTAFFSITGVICEKISPFSGLLWMANEKSGFSSMALVWECHLRRSELTSPWLNALLPFSQGVKKRTALSAQGEPVPVMLLGQKLISTAPYKQAPEPRFS
jgi:hypothetical protein